VSGSARRLQRRGHPVVGGRLSDLARDHEFVIQAIAQTMPLHTLVHFGDLARCYETSVSAVLILRWLGIEAEAVPTAAVVVNRSARDARACGWPNDFGGACRTHGVVFDKVPEADDGRPGHVVVLCGDTILDLTLGQLNLGHPGFVPYAAVTAKTRLDKQVIVEVAPGVSVSWHTAIGTEMQASTIRDTFAAFLAPQACGGFLAHAKALVALALLHPDDWQDRWPHLDTAVQRATAVGVGRV
jgi:hypothetical protein